MRIPQKREKKKRIKKVNKMIFLGGLVGLVVSSFSLILYGKVIPSLISLITIPFLFYLYYRFKKAIKKSERVKKMEDIFPDFLQLMASNLRAGMTIDRSMLLSVRKEFYPLDEEIQKAGRDIATGKDIETALLDMSKRIRSEKIHKTILLIIAGIRAGGNVATLLGQTAVSMREKLFVEKKAASNVLMYVIFIFIAASIGAPVLFSLSSLLVETLTNLLGSIPAGGDISIPFALSNVNISLTFIKYFSLAFIIVTDVLACLVLGLVNKGDEKEGLKYLLPMLAISISAFFIIRFALSGFVQGITI